MPPAERVVTRSTPGRQKLTVPQVARTRGAWYRFRMRWTVETLGPIVDAEIEALAADIQARLAHLSRLIEQHGIAHLPPKAAKYLGEGLWELRLTGRDGIARVLYVRADGQRIVLLRAFTKKTQKTPPNELEIARVRAKQVTP